MAKVTDLKIQDQDYWTKRLNANAEYMYRFGDDIIPDINKAFNVTANSIDNKINAFYAKYGEVRSSPTYKTLADGTQVVSGTSNKLIVTKRAADVRVKGGTRLTKLQSDIYSDLIELSKVQNNLMKSQFSVLAQQSYYDMYYELYRGYGIGTSFKVLSPTVVNQLMLNPVNGQNFSTRIWNNREALANRINQSLTNGIIQGKSNKAIAKEIAGYSKASNSDMKKAMKVAERLIRTEVTNTYNQASLQGYKDSGMVQKYEYIATLDNRTSEICSALDGEIFDVDKAITGVNMPPMHTGCRSTTSAHFDDSKEGLTRIARELGGNTFTVPATMDNANYKAIYVDKTLTRKQWDAGKRTPDTRGQQLRKSVQIEMKKRL